MRSTRDEVESLYRELGSFLNRTDDVGWEYTADGWYPEKPGKYIVAVKGAETPEIAEYDGVIFWRENRTPVQHVYAWMFLPEMPVRQLGKEAN